MKNLFLVLACTLVFAACGGGSGPESAALSFAQKVGVLDLTGAGEFATEDTKKLLTAAGVVMAMAPDKKAAAAAENKKKADLLKKATCEVDGDNAICTLCCDENGDSNTEMVLKMKKVDGKWLVNISKEDAKKER